MPRLLGFTLIEGLVTLAVVSVLAAVAIPSLADMLDRRRVENAAIEFANDARFAYSLTRATGNGVWFLPLDTCYNIQRVGGTIPCRCKYSSGTLPAHCQPGGPSYGGIAKSVDLSDAKVKLYPSAVVTSSVFSTFTVSGVTGLFMNPSYVELEGTRGSRLRVNISLVGRTSICVVSGNYSAYPSC